MELHDFLALQHLAQHPDLVVARNSRVIVDLNSSVSSKPLGLFRNLRAADHVVDDLAVPLYLFAGLGLKPAAAIELQELISPQHAVLVVAVDDFGIEEGGLVAHHCVEVKSLALFKAQCEEYSCAEADRLIGLVVGGIEERVAWYFCDVEEIFGVDDLVHSYVQGQVVLPLNEEVDGGNQLSSLLLPFPEPVVLHDVGGPAEGSASHALLSVSESLVVKVD